MFSSPAEDMSAVMEAARELAKLWGTTAARDVIGKATARVILAVEKYDENVAAMVARFGGDPSVTDQGAEARKGGG